MTTRETVTIRKDVLELLLGDYRAHTSHHDHANNLLDQPQRPP